MGQGTGGTEIIRPVQHDAEWDRVLTGTESVRPVQHKAVWDKVLAGPRSQENGERGSLYETMHCYHQNQSAFRWAAVTRYFEVSTHSGGQRKKVFMDSVHSPEVALGWCTETQYACDQFNFDISVLFPPRHDQSIGIGLRKTSIRCTFPRASGTSKIQVLQKYFFFANVHA